MNEKEIQAWRDIIMTGTVTALALVKVLTEKGLVKEEDIVAAVAQTKKNLAASGQSETRPDREDQAA